MKISDVEIRDAEVSDALEIQRLVSSLSHFYVDDYHLEASYIQDGSVSLPTWFAKTLELSEFQQRLSNEEFSNFVCVDGSGIIGYISIKNQSHLYHLFVAEEHHGKGIAKALWNHIQSKQQTMQETKNYTVRSSLFAVPIYQSFGFKITEPASSKEGIGFQAMELVR